MRRFAGPAAFVLAVVIAAGLLVLAVAPRPVNSTGVVMAFTRTEQGAALLNAHSDSAPNTVLTISLTGTAGQRIHIYSLTAACSAGNADVLILDGGTEIWHTASNSINTVAVQYLFPVPLTISTGSNSSATLGACGTGNVGHLSVQADKF